MARDQGYYNLSRFIGKNYAETDELRCLRVFIPDGDEYAMQLMTLINVAGTRAAWWTDTNEQREARATIWQRAYEETLAILGDGCMDCSWILDCLEDPAFVEAMDNFIASLMNDPSSNTRAAITNVIQQQVGDAQGHPLSAATRALALNQGADVCDENSLWGACLHAIVTLNRLNLDFLETMEAATENQEIVSEFVAAIPVLETFPIDEAIVFADKVRAFVAEFYAAGYDVDLEMEFACELFCLALDNDCTLTMDVIVDYFWNRAELLPGFNGAFETAQTIISAMASWQEMVGESVVVAMMACNVGFMFWLNSALGMDFGRFQLQARAGVPDDDWTNCGCGSGCANYNFVIDSYAGTWAIRQNVPAEAMSTYSAGVGYVPRLQTLGGANNWQNQIHTALPVGCSSADVVYYIASGTPAQVQAFWLSTDLGTASLLATLNVGTGLVSTTIDLETSKPVWATRLLLVSSHISATPRVATWKECNFSA